MSMMQTSVKGSVTPVSYHPAENMTLEEGKGAFDVLRSVHNSSPWWIGDLLVFMQDHYGESWSHVVSDTMSYEIDTINGYMRLARAYPVDQRREGLSMSHHRELLTVPPEHRGAWMDRIESEGLSVRDLRVLRLEEESSGKTENIRVPTQLVELVRKLNPKLISMCSHAKHGDTWVTEAQVPSDDDTCGYYRVVVSVAIVSPVQEREVLTDDQVL